MTQVTAYDILLNIAVPRPNGSQACEETARAIADFMGSLSGRVQVQEFFLRPYMQAVTGAFFLTIGIACLVLLVKRRYWIALLLSLIIPAVYIAEFEFDVPVVSWIGGRTGVNVIADFLPPGGEAAADRYITFSAHYDSKTDLFDHEQRKPIYSFAPVAMACLIAASAVGVAFCRPRRRWTLSTRRAAPTASRVILLALAGVGVAGLFMLALAFGGGLLVPAHLQSPGARDDGAAVAVLMSLAEKLASSQPHQPQLERTAVRLVFFGGEEVNLPGSAAYAAAGAVAMGGFAEGPVINCELVGGAAPFCYWESSGTFLSKYCVSEQALRLYQEALSTLGLSPAVNAGSIFDDSGRLLAAGLQAIGVGHGDPGKPDSYHNAGDSVDRVVPQRLDETEQVFLQMISIVEREETRSG